MSDRVLWQGRAYRRTPVRLVWHKFPDGFGEFMTQRFNCNARVWYVEGWLDSTTTALAHDLLPPLWFAHRWNRLRKTLRRR